jgi:hypothetical protein
MHPTHGKRRRDRPTSAQVGAMVAAAMATHEAEQRYTVDKPSDQVDKQKYGPDVLLLYDKNDQLIYASFGEERVPNYDATIDTETVVDVVQAQDPFFDGLDGVVLGFPVGGSVYHVPGTGTGYAKTGRPTPLSAMPVIAALAGLSSHTTSTTFLTPDELDMYQEHGIPPFFGNDPAKCLPLVAGYIQQPND